MRFRKWQNGRAISRDVKTVEAEVYPGRLDFLREGKHVVISKRRLQEQGPGTAAFGRRQITAIPKER